MNSTDKRKLLPTGTTPKKAEKIRKDVSESASTCGPLRSPTGFEGKRLFPSPLQKVRV